MTITIVNVHDAKTHFSRLLDRAHEGEEIVVAKAGKPYARLVPLAPQEKPVRRPGRLAGCSVPEAFFEPLPVAEAGAAADDSSDLLLTAGRKP
ncbi:MAG: type II toxin-antitoxin system prevent-host-death family antitoxin [Candidatus Accumulibacter sp.]|uniref:type II toxin-antitoxin system Phd/YefM family antitoxin n=1 Tax=Accumulibacter sp. TaxID=2053492 RepID=UPI00287B2596|nr:type II toxin-antitoxin system prevent-host-death family antitoxin [Accumulibacter sp.]MDS4015903.1 type II toxin-antitoxin system prevent-host-death family antitoxin [Accumulibacter sp.]